MPSSFAYSNPFGVPLYIFGLIWFPLLLALAIWMRPHINTSIMLPLLMVGNFFTVYLWFVELYIAGAICPVCVSMYIVNYVMTVIAAIALR